MSALLPGGDLEDGLQYPLYWVSHPGGSGFEEVCLPFHRQEKFQGLHRNQGTAGSILPTMTSRDVFIVISTCPNLLA